MLRENGVVLESLAENGSSDAQSVEFVLAPKPDVALEPAQSFVRDVCAQSPHATQRKPARRT